MDFLELTGAELLEMEVKPWELYLKLRYGKNLNPAQVFISNLGSGDADEYHLLHPNSPPSGTTFDPHEAYEAGETPIPEAWLHSSESYTPISEEITLEQVEWYGFGYAFRSIDECRWYYPQIFTGYWVPVDSGGQYITPIPELEGERDLLIPYRYRRPG